jgi:transposase
VDVPAKLATRVRMLSTGHGRKNDDADAVSVGIAALTAPGLRCAAVEQTILALRALVEHRDDVVRTRTQTINRLHVLLTQLLPGGAPRGLDAQTAARLLRTVRPRATAPATLRRLAVELSAEIRHLDRRITTATNQISTAVAASATNLTQLRGIGDLTAGKILARVGDVTRFRSPAAFASYTGTAPIEVSSGDVVRHRLSRAGDRQLNCCLHIMAISQIQRDSPGRNLLPAQTRRGQGTQGSHAMPETPTVRRGLPPTAARRGQPHPHRRAGHPPTRLTPAQVCSCLPGSSVLAKIAEAQARSRCSPRRATGPRRNDLEGTEHRRRIGGGATLTPPAGTGPGRTPGGDSTVQRGRLEPLTPALRISHCPDPSTLTLQPRSRST